MRWGSTTVQIHMTFFMEELFGSTTRYHTRECMYLHIAPWTSISVTISTPEAVAISVQYDLWWFMIFYHCYLFIFIYILFLYSRCSFIYIYIVCFDWFGRSCSKTSATFWPTVWLRSWRKNKISSDTRCWRKSMATIGPTVIWRYFSVLPVVSKFVSHNATANSQMVDSDKSR